MSKASTASAKTSSHPSSQSAWAKGPPPNSNSLASLPRSQSPAPSHAPSPITISHSHRPSTFAQGLPINEGVSVPRSDVGSVRQGGSAVTFGSIDDLSPLSYSPAATPVIKTESVKSFGSIPATPSTQVNGKPLGPVSTAGSSKLSVWSAASTSNVLLPSPASTTSASTSKRTLFQASTSSSSQTSSDTSSPSTRPSDLPSDHQPSSTGQHPPQSPAQPSKLSQYAQFSYHRHTHQQPRPPHTPHPPAPTMQEHSTMPLSPRNSPPSSSSGTPTISLAVPHSPHISQSPPSHSHQPSSSSTSVSSGSATCKHNDRRSQADVDYLKSVFHAVIALLDELTLEKFDFISDQIIAWANKSEKEKDGMTLILVIRQVYERATRRATQSEMYARLCRKMMENISPEVQDDEIRDPEGKPVAGGKLFRKYLLNRCQEDFERGWVTKEGTAATAVAGKASDDQAVKAANEKKSGLYSYDYAAQKARRQSLGLIKFIGELFKLRMLTERIMHECIKKFLVNVETPEEEEIERLCHLLKTVGHLLDVPKARAHMDVYFTRMRDICKSPDVSPRMQFMLQDVIELRDRKWVARSAVIKPATVYTARGAAAKGPKKPQSSPRIAISKDNDGVGVSVALSRSKAGDLLQLGIVSKSSPMVMGPSSVSTKKAGKCDSLFQTNLDGEQAV